MNASLSFSLFVAVFVLSGLLLFVGLWLYYDFRDKKYYDRKRQLTVYHCVRCGNLYWKREPKKPAACGRCGFVNDSLRF